MSIALCGGQAGSGTSPRPPRQEAEAVTRGPRARIT
nr:MAG TPA: hypothetical protein [Caudoviricetes sp.]